MNSTLSNCCKADIKEGICTMCLAPSEPLEHHKHVRTTFHKALKVEPGVVLLIGKCSCGSWCSEPVSG